MMNNKFIILNQRHKLKFTQFKKKIISIKLYTTYRQPLQKVN